MPIRKGHVWLYLDDEHDAALLAAQQRDRLFEAHADLGTRLGAERDEALRELEQANENRLALWQGEHEQRNRAIAAEAERDTLAARLDKAEGALREIDDALERGAVEGRYVAEVSYELSRLARSALSTTPDQTEEG